MYNAIIADDEVHVCILLEKLVDWEKLGIRIIDTCTDGLETYRAIEEKRPDIVVTDIMMPGMNGLDIVKNCINHKIDVMFLLVSGHAEFEYAHMAIAYGVENYLLKPINGKELEKNLSAICEKLDRKKQQTDNLIEMQTKIHSSVEALAKQFLKHYLAEPGCVIEKQLEEINEEYFLNFSDGYFQMFIIKPTCKVYFTNQQLNFLLKQIETYASSELKKYYDRVIGITTELEAFFLVNGNKPENSIDSEKLFFSDLSTAFFEYCDITLSASGGVRHLKELSPAKAQKILLQRYNKGVNRYFRAEDLSENQRQINCKKYINTLVGNINIYNYDGIDDFFEKLLNAYMPSDIVIDNLLDTVALIKEQYVNCLKKIAGHKVEQEEAIEEKFQWFLRKSDSKKELFQEISAYIKQGLEEIREQENFDNNRVIRIAKEYIEEHLSEKIILEDIAQIVYMNPTYFSTLFKKETGENFSDYLTNARIEKARELLKCMDLSIQQVGEMVGYENARYFSKVFVKVVGISPSDYRKYSKFL